jgi:hypothetical protein
MFSEQPEQSPSQVGDDQNRERRPPRRTRTLSAKNDRPVVRTIAALVNDAGAARR